MRLKCFTLKCPYRDDWPDIHDLTVGKIYDVTVLKLAFDSESLSECEVTNDLGERMRVLSGHFCPVQEGP